MQIAHLQKLAWLLAAGALGTLARYALQGLVQRLHGSSFPWGTLAVNLLGCFLFGVIWTMAEERFLIRGETRLVLLVGFMGAFTTFSTYAFETVQLLRDSQWWLSTANVLAHTVLGVVGVMLGMSVGRLF